MSSENVEIQKEENKEKKYKNNLNLPQFFQLNSNEINIIHPYNFKEAINRLVNLTDENLKNEFTNFIQSNYETYDKFFNFNEDFKLV